MGKGNRMKQFTLIIAIFYALLFVPDMFAEMSVLTGTRFDLFSTDGAPETIGYEVTFPVGLTYTGKSMTLALSTAYGSASVYPGSGSSSNINSITDMRVAATYGIKGLPVGIFAGVDMNVPTGTERLVCRDPSRHCHGRHRPGHAEIRALRDHDSAGRLPQHLM